jgi:heterodisulfide reductase subunit A-like polyferredoxin
VIETYTRYDRNFTNVLRRVISDIVIQETITRATLWIWEVCLFNKIKMERIKRGAEMNSSLTNCTTACIKACSSEEVALGDMTKEKVLPSEVEKQKKQQDDNLSTQ